MSDTTLWGRALLIYPWLLEQECGARLMFLSYARTLREAGLQLDGFAPSRPDGMLTEHGGLFERIFVPSWEPAEGRFTPPAGFLSNPLSRTLVSADSRQGAAAAASVAGSGGYDVVGISYTRYAPIREFLPAGIRTVLFTYDLDSIVAQQEERVLGTPAAFELADELRLMCDFDLITAVGPDDTERLKSAIPSLPVIEAPFRTAIEPRPRPQRRSANRLLITSASASFLNESFAWFSERVWPAIRRRRPDVTLTVAGRISDIARSLGLGSDGGVEIKGVVPDLEPLYDAADVFVAPYLYGDGVKTKVLESLARGMPVITTPPGLSNTHLVAGEHVIVEESAEAYASAVVRLLEAPSRREALSLAGAAYVRRRHYSPDCHEALRRCVRAWRDDATAPEGTAFRDIPARLRRLLPPMIQHCAAEGIRRVAVCGTGGHSRLLLPLWKALGGPTVVGFLAAGAPESSRFMDLPVWDVAAMNPDAVDGIVLSSANYELEMAARCLAAWPGLPCYGIWSSVLPGQPRVELTPVSKTDTDPRVGVPGASSGGG